MKKVLLATSALVATTGFAAADVSLSGSAEMGIVGADASAGITNTDYDGITVFHQSVDVRFTMSGETDNGLTFGAQIDLDDLVDTGADPINVQGDFADFTVFISGDFGTLTMGDTDEAFDWALQEVAIGNPGSIADDETSHAGYSGNGLGGIEDFDGQVLRYNNSIGDFGFAVSAETEDNPGGDTAGDVVISVGVRYGMDFAGGSFGIGLGYLSADDVFGAAADDEGFDVVGVSAHVELDSGFSAAVNYSEYSSTLAMSDGEHIGVGIGYSVDALSFHANWGQFDWDTASRYADSEGFGLAAGYDLGGGASILLGYGTSDITALNGSTATLGDYSTWSLGIAMSF